MDDKNQLPDSASNKAKLAEMKKELRTQKICLVATNFYLVAIMIIVALCLFNYIHYWIMAGLLVTIHVIYQIFVGRLEAKNDEQDKWRFKILDWFLIAIIILLLYNIINPIHLLAFA